MANIKRNLFYNFLLSCSQVVFPLLTIPYVARALGPESIGRVSFIDSFTFYFVTAAEFGIMMYGVREISRVQNNETSLRKLVNELFVLHLITTAMVGIIYAISLSLLWHRINDSRLIVFSVAFFVAHGFSCDWYFMGKEKFGYITLRAVSIRAAMLAGVFLLLKQPSDYYLYYGIIVLTAVLNHTWNASLLFKQVGMSFKGLNWKRHIPHMWVISLITVFYSIPLMLDNLLLGMVSVPAAIGLYAFSIKVVRLAGAMISDSFLVFFPRVVALEDQQEQRKQKLFLNLEFIFVSGIPAFAGIYLLADEIAGVFLGPEFVAASGNLRLLALFPLLKGVSLFLSNPVLMANNLEKPFLRNIIIASLLFIPSALWLGNRYNDNGLCMALLGTEIVLIFLNFLSVHKHLHGLLSFPWKACRDALFAAAFFVPATWLLRDAVTHSTWFLIIAIISCVLLYGLLMVFVFRNEFSRRVAFSSIKGINSLFKTRDVE